MTDVAGLSESSDCPYDQLYIYYLKGSVKQSGPGQAVLDQDSSFIGNWEEDEYSFLFFSTPSYEKVETLLEEQPQLTFIDKYHMSYDDWHGGSIESFRAGRFLIKPPWQHWAKEDGGRKEDIRFVLDPGVVFGTGTHTTTNDCLDAIEQVCYENNIESVTDLGTGTGILSIAAAYLICNTACSQVLAVDFNFLAAKTAKKNVRLNQLEDKIAVVQGRAEECLNRPVDLIIANIHFEVMKQIILSEGFLNSRYFILSGLMRSEARHVDYHLSRLPVKIINRWQCDNIWHTFLGQRLA